MTKRKKDNTLKKTTQGDDRTEQEDEETEET